MPFHDELDLLHDAEYDAELSADALRLDGIARRAASHAASTAWQRRADRLDVSAVSRRHRRAHGKARARAFEFIQAQRRRYILVSRMAELLKDFDMYGPGTNGFDVGLHAQTGHPCAVVPYKFESPPSGRGGGGRGAAVDTTQPPVTYNPQPICAVLAGNLYNDDKILSVARQYQTHSERHLKHPSISRRGRMRNSERTCERSEAPERGTIS